MMKSMNMYFQIRHGIWAKHLWSSKLTTSSWIVMVVNITSQSWMAANQNIDPADVQMLDS